MHKDKIMPATSPLFCKHPTWTTLVIGP